MIGRGLRNWLQRTQSPKAVSPISDDLLAEITRTRKLPTSSHSTRSLKTSTRVLSLAMVVSLCLPTKLHPLPTHYLPLLRRPCPVCPLTCSRPRPRRLRQGSRHSHCLARGTGRILWLSFETTRLSRPNLSLLFLVMERSSKDHWAARRAFQA